MASKTEDIGRRFAAAAEARDAKALAALYSPDASFWNNVLRGTSTTEQVLELTKMEAAHIPDYRFDDVRCTASENGFVLQMTVTGTTDAGTSFAVAGCLVAQVDGDRITRIDEYVDATQARPIFEAILGRPA